jgi:hypothetical protein
LKPELLIRRNRRTAAFIGGLFLAAAAAGAQDAAEILRRSIEHDAANIELLKNYTFVERNEERTYDGSGRLKSRESETYEILILEGRPWGKQIERNDKPLDAKDARREQEKLDRELAKRKRETDRDPDREDKDTIQSRRFLREVPQAFVLSIDGVEQIDGRPVWVISATPRAGYRPKLPHGDVLTKVRGKIWIDQAEYQWVKVDAEAIAPLSFGLGLLRLAPGGSLHFEQTRVNDEVWLPSKAEIRADARVAYVRKLRAEMDIQYRDYKKFQSDSRILEAAPETK